MEKFRGQQYINLETFRKSGLGVQTPVWFVLDGDVLYVRTVANSGKIKRLRNNPRLRVAPCDARGGLLGDWQEAEGVVVQDEQKNKEINQMIGRKYGLTKQLFDLMGKLQKRDYAGIIIRLREEN